MKIKPLTKEQLIISIDRLTRFKETETKYLRVFKDIIVTNLIEPKIKRHELDEIDYEDIKNYAEEIINSSVANIQNDLQINQNLFEYENSVFNLSKNTQTLLKNKINYNAIINIFPDEIPNNLKWLKTYKGSLNTANSLGYPVQKIVLCEGITEEILIIAL